ncbi:MAG: hypothetical protein JWM36_3202 [Hyphomicrobiales bacterium]|nr:hypothetical protein [Hyphomicrobiales bacterium]
MRFSVGNISGRPLSIDGLDLAEGERIDHLENVSDEVRGAADRGEVMILETPRAEDPQGLNRIPAPSAASPTPVEAASNDGVLHNPANGDPDELQATGLRRDPAGARVDPARADVSISDPAVPGSVAAAESKQPIASHSDLAPGSNASPSPLSAQIAADNLAEADRASSASANAPGTEAPSSKK